MVARMLLGCLVVSLVFAVGWAASAQGQHLYAGPGTVVQTQIRGPFVYGIPLYSQLVPVPPFSYPYSGPVVVVPAPGPYLEAPVIVPPGQVYAPSSRPPGYIITPRGIPIQPYGGYRAQPYGYGGYYVPQPYGRYQPRPYGGYQPRLDRPRFADPYAQPQWRGGQMPAPQTNAAPTPPAPMQDPTEVRPAAESTAGKDEAYVEPLKGASRSQTTTAAEPNKPANP